VVVVVGEHIQAVDGGQTTCATQHTRNTGEHQGSRSKLWGQVQRGLSRGCVQLCGPNTTQPGRRTLPQG
jgi:hypothetical protein